MDKNLSTGIWETDDIVQYGKKYDFSSKHWLNLSSLRLETLSFHFRKGCDSLTMWISPWVSRSVSPRGIAPRTWKDSANMRTVRISLMSAPVCISAEFLYMCVRVGLSEYDWINVKFLSVYLSGWVFASLATPTEHSRHKVWAGSASSRILCSIPLTGACLYQQPDSSLGVRLRTLVGGLSFLVATGLGLGLGLLALWSPKWGWGAPRNLMWIHCGYQPGDLGFESPLFLFRGPLKARTVLYIIRFRNDKILIY